MASITGSRVSGSGVHPAPSSTTKGSPSGVHAGAKIGIASRSTRETDIGKLWSDDRGQELNIHHLLNL